MSDYQATIRLQANRAKDILWPLLWFVALIWMIEVFDRIVPGRSLDQLGILPRQPAGLLGIILAPFLHGNFSHLLANTIPFLILGFLVRLRHRGHFLLLSTIIVLISGLGTWLIAPANTVHIGASGLIFGYFAFLVVNAWYERSLAAIVPALLVIVLYGGLIGGILPIQNGLSWQGHLFGLVGGALAAFYLSPRHG
ncbi:MAG: rhomboid family intramembrane serine protease [Anaerolineales bacterium]|uniref:rhomboid family intramembrane serine protease n=1 Tax=Promineifilum sp. TaxID=2664178 RepID=UPI001DCA1523|nr:rhomboid family intramembrane serine protease [Anaerolineales bacterium]MCB8934901.1 rhomboid family intramembrane serine protease [Promineifilum sp.]MCO5178496.1 rhomboid family intramembrane serine protease [Promineifilum sp.]